MALHTWKYNLPNLYKDLKLNKILYDLQHGFCEYTTNPASGGSLRETLPQINSQILYMYYWIIKAFDKVNRLKASLQTLSAWCPA